MSKFILIILFSPFFIFAQQSETEKIPYKYAFTDLLHSVNNKQNLDSSKTGYSTLEYHSFASKGQLIGIQHQQILSKHLLFNLNLDKFFQEGIYDREELKLHNFKTSFFFANKSNNYNANLSLLYNKINVEENGGIENYYYSSYEDALLNPVILSAAKNEAKNRHHFLDQNFKISNVWSLSNQLSFLTNRRVYTDQNPNSGFYSNIYIDSIQTYDSISNIHLYNTFGISYKNLKFYNLLNYRKYYINTLDSNDIDLGLGIEYYNRKYKSFLNFNLYQSQQIKLFFSKTFNFKSTINKFDFNFNKTRIPISFNSYFSNNFIFENNFSPTNNLKISYDLKYKNLLFSSQLTSYKNFIYLNKLSEYTQLHDSFLQLKNILFIKLRWKSLYTDQRLEYNYIENDYVFPLPQFLYTTSIWFQSKLFNNNMNAKVGAKLDYFKAYYALSYNPSLARYHIQEDQIVGDVPLLSSFINITVSNINVDISYYNLLSSLNTNTNYLIPNYPNYPAHLRLSIKWKLSNIID